MRPAGDQGGGEELRGPEGCGGGCQCGWEGVLTAWPTRTPCLGANSALSKKPAPRQPVSRTNRRPEEPAAEARRRKPRRRQVLLHRTTTEGEHRCAATATLWPRARQRSETAWNRTFATKINKLLRHAEVLSKEIGVSCQSSLHLDNSCRAFWLLPVRGHRAACPPDRAAIGFSGGHSRGDSVTKRGGARERLGACVPQSSPFSPPHPSRVPKTSNALMHPGCNLISRTRPRWETSWPR